MAHYVGRSMDVEPGDVVAVPAATTGYQFAIVTNLFDREGKPYVIWGSPGGGHPVRETPWDEFTRGREAARTDIRGGRHWTQVVSEARARLGESLGHRRLVQVAHGLPADVVPETPSAPPLSWRTKLVIASAVVLGLLLVLRQ